MPRTVHFRHHQRSGFSLVTSTLVVCRPPASSMYPAIASFCPRRQHEGMQADKCSTTLLILIQCLFMNIHNVHINRIITVWQDPLLKTILVHSSHSSVLKAHIFLPHTASILQEENLHCSDTDRQTVLPQPLHTTSFLYPTQTHSTFNTLYTSFQPISHLVSFPVMRIRLPGSLSKRFHKILV